MKPVVLLSIFHIWSSLLHSQTYTLTVLNGYGSGTYEAGDTVHVWSSAFYGETYFDHWASGTGVMTDSTDWHTRLIMPPHDVTVEAVTGVLPAEAEYLTTTIRGEDTLKQVWAGFPGTLPLKGLIWLFHGTNGSGENFFLNNDMLLCVNRFLSAGYAVIALDCEEKTLLQDFNGDDAFRWDYTVDSLINIDVLNIKAIRDTMIHRGVIPADITHIAFGYSAGGAFATHIATQLGWRAAVSHNSAGVGWVPSISQTPILYSMTEFDDHPQVGPVATLQAIANADLLESRGVCADFRLARAQPLYPERFNRDASISIPLSTTIYQELKSNNVLDVNDYLMYKSEQLIPLVAMNPGNWPVLMSLTPEQRIFVADEIDETFATHRFNSDLFGSDFRFIESLCESTTGITESDIEPLLIYPNPAGEQIVIPADGQPYTVMNLSGQRVYAGSAPILSISPWPPGMYIIRCGNRTGHFLKMN